MSFCLLVHESLVPKIWKIAVEAVHPEPTFVSDRDWAGIKLRRLELILGRTKKCYLCGSNDLFHPLQELVTFCDQLCLPDSVWIACRRASFDQLVD